ncbi:glycosyltransferase [Thermonema rossianum]|uniref:glycosyltransferase n=1 Tax=Thermonema rossianum TaxID=55505 RepID=UPI0006924902|nr:glycosyltransferase [Thermonema rossianum]
MHILKIIHGYPPYYNAGSEVYSQSICNELSKKHKVTVVTREENPYLPDFHVRYEKSHENLQFFYVNMAQGKDGFRHKELDAAFAQILLKQKPDIAHVGHLNHLSTGIIDVLNVHGIPIVFTLHDFWLMCPRGQFLQRNSCGTKVWELCDKQEDKKCATICYSPYFTGIPELEEQDIAYWTNWINARMKETKAIISKTDLFIAPSKYLLNRFVNEFHVPKDKIIYLDYGFPLHYLTPTIHKKSNEVFTFGYIGTHIPAKGVNLVIEAFNQLQLPAKLLIWGYKDEQSSNALRQQAATNPNIEFKGKYINQNLADEVFSQIDCIVVPSIWTENSPLVIHEAQACRIPVITANVGGMAEYVQDGVNGLLFEHRNVKSLLQKMQYAVQNPNIMKQLGKRGYLYSEDGQVPDIQSHCRELEKIYESLIEKKLCKSCLSGE